MKTYTETRNREPFDWNKALENPPELGSERHSELDDLAAMWVTCACGNQCEIIPRTGTGAPNDRTLKKLGVDFSDHIELGEWEKAKKTLYKIEERSAQIIKELAK